MGNFRNWGRIHKIRLENKEGGSNFLRNHGSWYQDVVRGDPIGGGSTCYTPDPWIEINKNSQETLNHKNFGMALFVGILEIGQEQAKLG